MRKAALMFSLLILVGMAGGTRDDFLGTGPAGTGSPADSRSSGSPAAAPGLPFVANLGQLSPKVALYVALPGGAVFVTRDGDLVYDLAVGGDVDRTGRIAIRESLVAARDGEIQGKNPAPPVVNTFIGSDPSRWIAGIPCYAAVDLGAVYDGIELLLQYTRGNVEKIFTVGPGADPSAIKVEIAGAQGLAVTPRGDLEVVARGGSLRFTQPVAYQTVAGVTKNVDVAYVTDGRAYGFAVGEYDRTETLTIDPLLASTFYGGSAGDGQSYVPCARDAEGNIYVANRTASLDLPTVFGAYDSTLGGSNDVFIAKFDPGLTTLLAATYLGGSGNEGAWPGVDMIVDGDDNVWIAGITKSSNFPYTPGVYDSTYNGSGDIFVAKLSPDLGTLLASTYLGGTGSDERPDLAARGSNIYLAGITSSGAFPTTPGSYNRNYMGGSYDCFVSKLDSGLTTLLASTLAGGSGTDIAEDIELSADGAIYTTGWTSSTGYPTTAGASFPTYRGGSYDGFISRFSNDLAALETSTFLGGSLWDFGFDLALDAAGSVYVTGHTASLNFPHTAGAYDSTYNSPYGEDFGDDAFVSRLNGNLSTLLASTYLGGTNWEIGQALAVKEGSGVFVAGNTNSDDLPVTTGAYDTTYGGSANKYAGDIFFARLDCALTSLAAATYLGGSGVDNLGSIVLDADANLYGAGTTSSVDFPYTSAAYDTSFNGGTSMGEGYDWGGDIVLAELDEWLSSAASSVGGTPYEAPLRVWSSPNPFSSTTVIRYCLTHTSRVRVAVYSATGQMVAVIWEGHAPAGENQVAWEGTDSSGKRVAPGVYLASLVSEGMAVAHRMVLVD